MSSHIQIPSPGESITEVTIGEWLVAEGDWVDIDQSVVLIETDKANLEVPSPAAGFVRNITLAAGADAKVGDVIATIEPGERPETDDASAPVSATEDKRVMPAAQRVLDQGGLSAAEVGASGPGGRLLKEDVIRHLAEQAQAPPVTAATSAVEALSAGARSEERVPMSRLRQTIARRLVEAQQNAALLTTFNEVDMSAVMALRAKYKQPFLDRYGIKLGFMSFFVKASIEALKTCPAVNAGIEGTDIVYRNYYDIGVAIGGGKGLVVPVIRNAELLSFAEIEQAIADFAVRARASRIKLTELQGGSFSITNGGIYGSMLSTPIVNPPQSGILGMHNIQPRPVALDGEVVIRPMMYVALTYDHRIVDGREAVTFLKRVKHVVEDPTRILLEV